MRYLLFFFFLFLHSDFVFAEDYTPTCASPGTVVINYDNQLAQTQNSCVNGSTETNKRIFVNLGSALVSGVHPGFKSRCDQNCTCPPPSVYNVIINAGVATAGCIDPAEETPSDDLCPSGYPKVNGECPVCIGEQNEDGTCSDDDSGSSAASDANASSPTSSPDSGSAASTGSGGGDDGDGGDNGGGGGGGDNGGNNNSGGGSASSASSSPSGVNNSTGSGSSSGNASSASGQCDPTAKNYLSCISSQKITAQEGDIPWVSNSGYGNWIPVSEDSPCPNKYRDASGEWWCSGGDTGGDTGGANGSATSGGASGSARSAAGKCDSTSEDYLRCISGQLSSSGSQTSASSANSSAARSSSGSGAFSSLGEKGEFDGEASEKKMDELKEELDQKIADIKADIQGEFGGTISGTGTIQDFCKSNIHRTEVCFGLEKWEPFLDPISAAIFLVACVMAFSIVLRG